MKMKLSVNKQKRVCIEDRGARVACVGSHLLAGHTLVHTGRRGLRERMASLVVQNVDMYDEKHHEGRVFFFS